MSDTDRPRSPCAGLADLFSRTLVRVLSRAEIEEILAAHRLYLETEYHQGHRANFASADLSGQDFSGLNLRGIKMDRAVLRGADFSSAEGKSDRRDIGGNALQRANLRGAGFRDAWL